MTKVLCTALLGLCFLAWGGQAQAGCVVAWKAAAPWGASPPYNIEVLPGNCATAKQIALARCSAWGFYGCQIEDSQPGRGLCLSANGGLLPGGQPFLFTSKVNPYLLNRAQLRCLRYGIFCQSEYRWGCNP